MSYIDHLPKSSNMSWYKNKNRHVMDKYQHAHFLKWHYTRLICCFLTKFMPHTNFIFDGDKENHIAVKLCNETTRMEPYWNNSLNFLCEMSFEKYYSRNVQQQKIAYRKDITLSNTQFHNEVSYIHNKMEIISIKSNFRCEAK